MSYINEASRIVHLQLPVAHTDIPKPCLALFPKQSNTDLIAMCIVVYAKTSGDIINKKRDFFLEIEEASRNISR
jgi:hypothetical protein